MSSIERSVDVVMRQKVSAKFADLRDTVHVNAGGPVTDADILDEIWNENVYRFEGTMLTGGHVVDVGANIGAFSLLALASHPQERVICVEPDKENFEIFFKNIKENEFEGRAYLYPIALGDKDGQVSMGGSAGGAAYVSNFEDGDVAMRTLPSLLEWHEKLSGTKIGEIDFLKMDCEGSEYRIIDAMYGSQWMGRVRWLAMEWHSTDAGTLGKMLGQLTETHSYSIIGRPKDGGMLWAHRHDV